MSLIFDTIILDNSDKTAILDFLNKDKQLYVDLLLLFFNKLSLSIDFKIKIQKVSIQLTQKKPFAVVGFRKKCNYLIIEFYSDYPLDDNRIIKTNKTNNSKIIHTINVYKDSDIDDAIINWIIKSYELTF